MSPEHVKVWDRGAIYGPTEESSLISNDSCTLYGCQFRLDGKSTLSIFESIRSPDSGVPEFLGMPPTTADSNTWCTSGSLLERDVDNHCKPKA